MHMLYCIPSIVFTLNGICIIFLTHACKEYYVWVCKNISKMCCWFDHRIGFPANLLSSLWCIFASVFPSHPSTITGCQGAHSSQPTCVRTYHAPSLTHRSYHTHNTNKGILLASVQNCGQGITIRPTTRTTTPNGLRSNLEFLPGRSPWHVGYSNTVNSIYEVAWRNDLALRWLY